MKYLNTVITGIGSYIPDVIKKNEDFVSQDFYSEKKEKFETDQHEIIEKFHEITGILERRYLREDQTVSDIAYLASLQAIEHAGINPETIDQIIVAHNFGDVRAGTIQTDAVPSLAARVKHLLGIKNPGCIAYDLLFGCPGWVQGMIQADAFIRAGYGKRFLVIGSEALSRVVDPYDRDSMIYADGAGAVIVEALEEPVKRGMLSFAMQSDTAEEAYFLNLGESNKPGEDSKIRYIKMQGRKIYEYAISKVPAAMKQALEKSGESVDDLKKILIHQANEKMDEAMINRFYRLYKKPVPEKIMPMSIHLLGNSSVATIPTLYHLIVSGQAAEHQINEGDLLLFASVGAGMSINAFVYKQ